jgi:hypothetical protein
MKIEDLKANIDAVMNDSYSLQLYFVLKQNGEYVLRLADLEDDSAAPELETLFADNIKSQILENEDLSLCQLSTDDERDNAIYRYDYETYPDELGVFKNFNITTATSEIPKFDFTQDDLGMLFGYIIYLGTMQNGIVLFKKHFPISLIKRDSFLLGAVKDKRRFEKVSGEDIIRMNGSIQLLKVNDQIYVLDIKMLERNMGFTELIQKAAAQTVASIEELGILEDIDVLTDAVAETSFARKLSKVKRTSPIFKLGITKETIVEFTKTTAELSGKFKYSADGLTIRLDTKKSKDAFLKLMNDAFLRSELTQQYYEASAKDQLIAE